MPLKSKTNGKGSVKGKAAAAVSAPKGKAPKKGGRVVRIDFSETEEFVLVPEGDYIAKVHDIEQNEGDKAPYWAWQFKIRDTDAKYNGQTIFTNTSLSPQSLRFLRQELEALGVDIGKSIRDIDIDDLIGRECVLTIDHDSSYDGRPRPKVVAWRPLEEDDEQAEVADDEGDTEEEETETEEEDEETEVTEETTITAEEVKTMDSDELDGVVDQFSLSKRLKKSTPIRKKRNDILAALEQAEVLEE
jgi:hypothetical protein